MLAARGVAMLDAPVSGGMEGAQTRDLLVMAGGEPATLERARPGARSPSPKCASGCGCGVQRSAGFVAGEEGRKIDEGYVGAASINSLGIAILALALIRLAVRLRYGAPALPADLPEPMKLAAHLSHYALYALMIGMPLLGWAMLSAAAYPVVVFRGLSLPAIRRRQRGAMAPVHERSLERTPVSAATSACTLNIIAHCRPVKQAVSADKGMILRAILAN
jgi:hypothetical protein